MSNVLWRKMSANCVSSASGLLSSSSSLSSRNRLILLRTFATRLFVNRLSYYTTDEELRETFSQFGKLKEARLIWDPKTKRPKGFGFVKFESEVDAQKALKAMDGKIYKGRLIFVEIAKSDSQDD